MTKTLTPSVVFLTVALMLSAGGCTNMSKTQQGTLSGAGIGAAGGAGIAALAGGDWVTGALIGGAVGGTVGYMKGSKEESR
jgi:hypothetical protein